MKEHLDFKSIKDHSELVSDLVNKVAADALGVLVGQIDPPLKWFQHRSRQQANTHGRVYEKVVHCE